MELEKYLELLIKQRQGGLSSEEENLLAQWLKQGSENLAIKDNLEEVWNVTQHYQHSYTPDVKAGLARFQQALGEQQGKKTGNDEENITNQPIETIVRHLQGKQVAASEAEPTTEGADLSQDIQKIWKITEQYQRSYTPDVAAGLARFQQTLAQLEANNNNHSFSELIIKRLSNNISDQENALLDQWLSESTENYSVFEELSQVWESTEEYQKSYEPDAQAGFARFQQLMGNEGSETSEKNTPVKPIRQQPKRYFNNYSIAAVIALLLVAGYWVLSNNRSLVEVKTANASKVIDLPDGSKVTLNKNSVLTYNKKFTNRVVNLKGEAFFEVTKQNGQSFSILSNDVKTEVLGTSFNVKAPNNAQAVEVTVVTGKVAVSLQKESTKKVFLVPGDKAIYQQKKATLTKQKSPNKNFLAWKTRVLDYENTSLKDILPKLEQLYQVKIIPQNADLLNCRFTGTFDNFTLKEVLQTIQFSLNASYEKSEDGYIIKGKGCK
ncbi:MAG TPA: hypothetical protein DCS93_14220 [Microscillaceae bacterium]|nr:hypothetical protein [Microscillaceae bacterium]